MKWKDVSIASKLYISFSCGVFVFVSVILLGVYVLSGISDKADELSKPRRDSILLSAELAHLQWASNVQKYLLNFGSSPLHVPLDGRECEFGKWFYGGGAAALSAEYPSLSPGFARLETLHRDLHASAGTIKKMVEAGDQALARKAFEGTTVPLLEGVQKELSSARQHIVQSSDSILSALRTQVTIFIEVALGISALGVVCGGLFAFLMSRSISGPLLSLTGVAERVSRGEFVTANIVQRDEVGKLASAFNSMVGAIKKELGVSQGIMHGITSAFAMCDAQGRVRYLNQRMLDLWGRTGTPEDYYGRTCGEFFYNDEQQVTLLNRAITDQVEILGYGVTRENYKKEKKHLVMDASPLRDLDEKTIGAFSLHTDLTEMYLQQERIAALNDRIYHSANEANDISQRQNQAFDRLTQQLQHTANMARQQEGGSREAARVIEDMVQTMGGMTHKAAQVTENARASQKDADDGVRIVAGTIDSMRHVAEQIEHVAVGMQALNEHATAIGRILDLIRDVADQTNLLALNAAIEAARAGDAGRGFAVVADEVRKLAEKTMQATSDVGQAVHAIMDGVRESSTATQKAVELAGKSTEMVNASGASLERILGMATRVALDTNMIAAETREQANSIGQVLHVVQEISTQSLETTSNMDASLVHVGELDELSGDLKAIIESMRSERRRDERFAIDEPYHITLELVGGEKIPARMSDISRSGVCVLLNKVPASVSEGGVVRITAPTPPFNQVLSETLSHVMWVAGQQVGLQFSLPISANVGRMVAGLERAS